MNPEVDDYIQRSQRWRAELFGLQSVLLRTGLTEEIKWGKPCYSHEGGNILILQEMKDFLAVMFFKGALLSDPHGVLEEQGPNSRSALRMRFTSVADVERLGQMLSEYVVEAIAVERSGETVGPAPEPEWVPELRERLDKDPDFSAAFDALTPGRRREYNLHFGSAKQATTRVARIERYAEQIMAGRGLRDR
jgi:uncharacterized protein YdeI (YjbR/CyaY-like superfamily)